ncbi:MAG: cyclic nucleotide-binding/CBS domain-containing protein [Chloroflexaceae bacterium]
MRTVRGHFNGSVIELLEDAPIEGRGYVLVTFLEGGLEMAAARGERTQRDVLRAPADYARHEEDSYTRFTVGAIMTREIVTVPATCSVAYATHIMRQKGITSVIVEPDDGGEWGIMTMRDVLKHIIGTDRSPEEVTLGTIASRPLIYVTPDTSLRDCSRLMIDSNIRRLVIKAERQPVGIISDTDVFHFVEERGWGPL